jgi:hypothetical protein
MIKWFGCLDAGEPAALDVSLLLHMLMVRVQSCYAR